MTTEIMRNHGIIQGLSPSQVLKALPKSETRRYSGANILCCCLPYAVADDYSISAPWVRLFFSGRVVTPSPLLFPHRYADLQMLAKAAGFLSQRGATRGTLYTIRCQGRKVAGNYQQKVDILLQLSHHKLSSGESLTEVSSGTAMMLSAEEKILNNKSVVFCNV